MKWPLTTPSHWRPQSVSARPGCGWKLGPLALGVRSPVALALGASSVASLTGCEVDLALGASSPGIVAGWHDRPWAQHAARMRETIECLRTILTGTRVDYTGRLVHSHGFRLRNPLPDSRIVVGVFGPALTRVAAEHADEVVLNLVPPARVADMRVIIDAAAAAAGRIPPRLTVWVPVAVNPGEPALRQLAAQLAVYLAPPGYGEMFSELGFLDLVQRARAGARRLELATAVPVEFRTRRAPLAPPTASRRDFGPTTTRVRTLWRSFPHGRGPRRRRHARRASGATQRNLGLRPRALRPRISASWDVLPALVVRVRQ